MTPTAANPAPERRGSPSKLATLLLLIATLLAWLPPATASAQGSVPVKVGGDPESDACGGLGRIVGLDPGGDNFLAVREGPASTWAERDRLGPDTLVAICDERGAWLGIVYPAPGTDADCGVSSPQETRAPYRGPCRWGWVHRRFVALVAG